MHIAGDAINLTLEVTRPYDARPLLAYLRIRAIPGMEQVENDCYRRVVRISGESRLLTVDFSRARDSGIVFASCTPGCGLAVESVGRIVESLIDADAPMIAIEEQLAQDPLLAPLVRRNSGARIPGSVDPFELAVRAILGQQISVAAARTLASRIAARWGWAFAGDERELTIAFPDPERLVGAQLENIGVSRARADAIHDLAAAVVSETIELRPRTDSKGSEEALGAIKGIGPWTVAYIALRGLCNRDAIPVHDLGLRQALGHDTKTWHSQALAERAENWRPWRGYGAVHLWNTFLSI